MTASEVTSKQYLVRVFQQGVVIGGTWSTRPMRSTPLTLLSDTTISLCSGKEPLLTMGMASVTRLLWPTTGTAMCLKPTPPRLCRLSWPICGPPKVRYTEV